MTDLWQRDTEPISFILVRVDMAKFWFVSSFGFSYQKIKISVEGSWNLNSSSIPYDSPFCKQWPKGPGKIPKFWPLHSVRQNIPGFRRGLFACFLGHTPLLQYYLLFGPHPLLQLWRSGVAQKAGNTVIRVRGPKSRQINPSWNPQCFATHCAGVKIWEFCPVLLASVYKISGEPPRKIAGQKNAI